MPNETKTTNEATTAPSWAISPNAEGPSRRAMTLLRTSPVAARTICMTAYWLNITMNIDSEYSDRSEVTAWRPVRSSCTESASRESGGFGVLALI